MTQTILITGCSTGFGFDASKRFAKQGHQVFATMRNTKGKNAAATQALRDFAKQEGVQLDVRELDVTSDASVKSALTDLPTVDVLINNAGVGYGGPVEAFTPAQVLAQLDVNVVGTHRVARAVLPKMRAARSGLIVQLSSIAGRLSLPGFGVYHASKWGLEGLSETLRYELGPLGIDVVMVEPGPFATSFFEHLLPASDDEVAVGYPHVAAFGDGFKTQVLAAFEDPAAPTDPGLVIDAIEALMAMAPGTRPLRTIAGLDFGAQAVNDALEPLRQQSLASIEISDWDGAQASR